MEKEQISLVVVTDYDLLSGFKQNNLGDIINLWTPTPWRIKRLNKNSFVYFLSKQVYGRKICGEGQFIEYKELTLIDAWNHYGKANGVASYEEFVYRVKKYTEANSLEGFKGDQHVIGCILLKNVILFNKEEEVKPEVYGWNIPSQVVKCKYVSEKKTGSMIYKAKREDSFMLIEENVYKQRNSEMKDRRGQYQFRLALLEAYDHMCCISKEWVGEVLEAAHIQEYRSPQSNHIQNGLILRSDFHNLFDAGLLTITSNYTVKISSYLDSDYYNKFNNKKIYLPSEDKRPSIAALQWHEKNIFRQ